MHNSQLIMNNSKVRQLRCYLLQARRRHIRHVILNGAEGGAIYETWNFS